MTQPPTESGAPWFPVPPTEEPGGDGRLTLLRRKKLERVASQLTHQDRDALVKAHRRNGEAWARTGVTRQFRRMVDMGLAVERRYRGLNNSGTNPNCTWILTTLGHDVAKVLIGWMAWRQRQLKKKRRVML